MSFAGDFTFAQRAFADGNLDALAERLEAGRRERARHKAARARALRQRNLPRGRPKPAAEGRASQ